MLTIQGCQRISRTFVTTDDEELLRTARQYPNLDCVVRPPELAEDPSTTEAVLHHLIKSEGLEESTIVLLQLTSPFRTSADVNSLIEKFVSQEESSAVSVCLWRPPASPPYGDISDDQNLGVLRKVPTEESVGNRNQTWAINGAIYIFKAASFLETGRIYDEKSAIHIMENWRSIDIDYEDDVTIACAIAEKYNI